MRYFQQGKPRNPPVWLRTSMQERAGKLEPTSLCGPRHLELIRQLQFTALFPSMRRDLSRPQRYNSSSARSKGSHASLFGNRMGKPIQ